MDPKLKLISIVTAFNNEEEDVEEFYERVKARMEGLALPGELEGGSSSWFGYPLRLTPDAPIYRDVLSLGLNARRIGDAPALRW